jgi:hypothetical protein
VRSLEVEPEFRGGPEGLREKPGGLRGDTTLPADELIDTLNGNAKVLGEGDLGLIQRDEEIFTQDLSRVSRHAVCGLHDLSSVVVDDLHLVSLRVVPTKDDSPLLVDADAVVAGPVSSHRLEPVARRGSEIPEFVGSVDRVQLAQGNGPQIAWEPRCSAAPDPVVEVFR